jgi:cellobiose-specific phosphotransferase system component IIA
MPAPDWMAYLTAAKTALDIIKGIRSELPKGPEADKAQQQIEKAEAALKTSHAQLAKSLGFKLCKCSFPPPIMLWHAADRLHICPACGDRFPPLQQNVPKDDYITVRR